MTTEEVLKMWQDRMKEISRQMAQDNIVHLFSYGIVEEEGENFNITASGALKGSGKDISMILASAIEQDKNIAGVLTSAIQLADAKLIEETKQ